MALHFDVRVNGVSKLSNQIEEIPSFHFEGKEVVIRATLVEEPPTPDVPRMNYGDIQAQLAAEDQAMPGPGNQEDQAGDDKDEDARYDDS